MVPSRNMNVFSSRQNSFKCRISPLNPARGSVKAAATATDSTRQHLANLDKLLQKPLEKQLAVESKRQTLLEKKRKVGLLEGLNLAQIWPQPKPEPEMSPNHLRRLQRLLSRTEEYSPRKSLARRWREYHGSRDWDGLLDPLDENLRREVVRYGELVQAAYQAFHSNPATVADEASMHRHVAVPDRSYKVTKSLYATSSVGLPKWVDDMAPDLDWMTQRSSWIGYVAVCDDKKEIQRMGRRDIVIALRGTATCLEWAENLRAQLVPMSNNEIEPTSSGLPKVEAGFLSLFKTQGVNISSLAESVIEEVKRLMEQYKNETLSITITGHSLGAALALLVANELTANVPDVPPVAVFSFGGPRVGNRAFADMVESNNVKVLRIVNNQDVITQVPGAGVFVGNQVEQRLKEARLAEELWDYSHVGTELRVDTKMSPYLKPNADVACCHDLEAYLHLVDGFSSPNCPFRVNAKRSLVKLLHEQGSNVKRLYTSKAKALTLTLDTDRRMSVSGIGCLPSPS